MKKLKKLWSMELNFLLYFSSVVLLTYLLYKNPIIYYSGFILLKTSFMFFSYFIILGIGFDTIKKQMA